MTKTEKLDKLYAIFAYDTGATDSGYQDDAFKASLRGNTDCETAELLDYCAWRMLTEGAYTLSDIKRLIEWSETELEVVW